MDNTKNQQIIDGIIAGDSNILKSFYKKNLPPARNLILQYQGTIEDVEDIFQEALILIYHKGRKGILRIDYSIHTYFIGICKNKWYVQLRLQQRLVHDDALVVDAMATDISITDTIIQQEQATLYDKHYHTLSEANKTLLQLFFDGHSMREIAAKMGYPEGYVRKKKFEIKKYLTRLVQSEPEYIELIN